MPYLYQNPENPIDCRVATALGIQGMSPCLQAILTWLGGTTPSGFRTTTGRAIGLVKQRAELRKNTMIPPRPHPYDAILRSAARRPELWRIAVQILVALALGALVTPVLYGLIGRMAPTLMPIRFGPNGVVIGAAPGGMFVLLAGYAVLLVGSVVLARRLHNRSLREITGPANVMRRQFFATLKWVALLSFVTMLLPWDSTDSALSENLNLGMWLFWMPFALLGLMIQITAEEVFFRGYLQSQLIASTKSYTLGVLAASVLFGLGHLSGAAEGTAAIFPVVWAMLFGLLAGDLTARSGTIGPACALHLMNNATAMLIAPQQDIMSGFGRMVQTLDLTDAYSDPKVIVFQTLLLLATWLTARLALRR